VEAESYGKPRPLPGVAPVQPPGPDPAVAGLIGWPPLRRVCRSPTVSAAGKAVSTATVAGVGGSRIQIAV